jgi:Asp/Glu/hydantoin racemase
MTAEIISFPMTKDMQLWVESVCVAIRAQAKAIEMQQKQINRMADLLKTLMKKLDDHMDGISISATIDVT